MKSLLGRSSKKTNPSVDLRQPDQPPSAPSARTPKQDQAAIFDSPEFTGWQRQPARAVSQRQSISSPAAGANLIYGQGNRSEDKLSNRSSAFLNTQGSSELTQEKEHKKRLRDKFGLGQSSRQSVESRAEGSSRTNSVNRAGSFSKKSSTDSSTRAQSQQGDPRGPSWSTAGSNPHLIPHAEEDESTQYEIYQTQPNAYTEQVTQQALDNAGHDQYYSPDSLGRHQYPPPPHQQQQQVGPPPNYYTQQPLLHRIDTDQSHQSHYTDPDHHPDPLLSPLPPQHTYQQPDNPNYYQQPGSAYQPQETYQRGYQHHPDSLSSPAHPRHPDNFVGQGHPQAFLPIEQERSKSRASSSQFDGSSVQGSRASFEQQGQYRDQDEVVYVGTAQTAHPSSKQDTTYLHPPGTNAAQIHPPPSPLHAVRDQPTSVSPQPPSPADEATTPMPRDPPARANNSLRQSDSRSGNRESSSFPQQGVPPTPGFTTSGSTHSVSRGQKIDDKGRETPAPAGDMSDEQTAHYHQLMKDHKELKEKYQKVKKYYFEKESQVHNLQNTLAHQRLSQSRTSLDDSEYGARFGRLDGLISQLAFGIRKSWKTIPEFLQRAVNKDAIAIGKQEMTVVGRAYISNWLVSEVFNEYFHPDLDLQLNQQLRVIFANIRAACPPFQSKEEEEALNSKMINWRMTTLEGLQHQLNSAAAPQNRAVLMDLLKDKLIKDLSEYLVEPAPPDLTGGVTMIVELAINIAIHLPLESRDVVIEYYHPGDAIVSNVMKIETGIPSLSNPIAQFDLDTERASLKSAAGSNADNGVSNPDENGKEDGTRAGKKPGILSGIMGGGSSAGNKQTGKTAPAQAAPVSKPVAAESGPSGAGKEERVRLAAGVSVQIRGRSVLMKAPVYAL